MGKFTCPLNARPGWRLYSDLRDKQFGVNGKWSLNLTDDGKILWLDPQPSLDQISEFYPEYHTQKAPGKSQLSGLKWAIRRAVLARFAGYPGKKWPVYLSWFGRLLLRKTLQKVNGLVMNQGRNRLLDIGCGNGEFLWRMHQLGWQASGVEFDSKSAGLARKTYGFDVRVGTLEEAQLEPGSFDSIHLSHVIEHLPSPRQTLSRCFELLSPGGQLVLLTPNLNSWGHSYFKKHWRGLEVPRHLFVFSLEGLTELVESVGFVVDQVTTRGQGAVGIWLDSQKSIQGNINKAEKRRAKFFELVEKIICPYWPIGEELFLIARKP